MKCCTLPDGDGRKGDGRKMHKLSGRHKKRVTKLGVAAGQCAGKHGKTFRKCVKAKIKKMR